MPNRVLKSALQPRPWHSKKLAEPVDGLACTVGKNQIFRSKKLASCAASFQNFRNHAALIEWNLAVTRVSFDIVELSVVNPLDDEQPVAFYSLPMPSLVADPLLERDAVRRHAKDPMCLQEHPSSAMHSAHMRVAKELGAESLVERCYTENGTAYEKAIHNLLVYTKAFKVTVIDDGKRQNVPDFLVQLGSLEALIECKSATKNPALINKEDAWAVIQKATDFDQKMRRITIGKPAFDETSKRKAAASTDLTLIENGVFVEAVLRLLQKTLSPEKFMAWITTPGVSELERLPGDITYSK